MPQTPPITDLVSSAQVCEMSGMDRSTLSRWVKDGTATPALRLTGRTGAFLFTRAEAERLVGIYRERVA